MVSLFLLLQVTSYRGNCLWHDPPVAVSVEFSFTVYIAKICILPWMSFGCHVHTVTLWVDYVNIMHCMSTFRFLNGPVHCCGCSGNPGTSTCASWSLSSSLLVQQQLCFRPIFHSIKQIETFIMKTACRFISQSQNIFVCLYKVECKRYTVPRVLLLLWRCYDNSSLAICCRPLL